MDYKTCFYIVFGGLFVLLICLCLIEKQINRVEDKVDKLLSEITDIKKKSE